MKIRAAVLDEMGRPGPYAQTRPVAIETVELDAPKSEGASMGALNF
jgi:alcohol dehydrogenase